MSSFLSCLGKTGRLVIAGSILAVLAAGPVAAQTKATSFSGDASGVIASVNIPPVAVNETLVHAGPLSSAGGSDSDELADASIAGVLTASGITADTTGSGKTATSNAEILDLSVPEDGSAVTSSTLNSQAVATCGKDGATVSGSSVIEDLMVNGAAVEVTGDPNQVVPLGAGDLGAGTVTLNEQDSNVASDGSKGEITVNAIHIVLNNPVPGGAPLADVVLAQSHADVTCLPDSSTEGAIEAMGTSTGGPANSLPLALALVGGLAVSMLLLRPLVRR